MKKIKSLLFILIILLNLLVFYSCKKENEKKIITPEVENNKNEEEKEENKIDKELEKLNNFKTDLVLEKNNDITKEILVYDLEVNKNLKSYGKHSLTFNNIKYNKNKLFKNFEIYNTNNINSDNKNGLILKASKSGDEEQQGWVEFNFENIKSISKIEFNPIVYNNSEKDLKNLETFKIFIFKENEYIEYYDASNNIKNKNIVSLKINDMNINKFKFILKANKYSTRVAIKNIKIYQNLYSYNVLFDKNEGEFKIDKKVYNENDLFNLSIKPKKEGYIFSHWVNIDTKEVVDNNYIVKKDMILKAFWTKKVKLIFDLDNKNQEEENIVVIEKNIGDIINNFEDFPKLKKDGYKDSILYKIVDKNKNLIDIVLPLKLNVNENLLIKLIYEKVESKDFNNFKELKDLYNQNKEFNFNEININNVSYKKIGKLNFLIDINGELLLINQKEIDLEENNLYNLKADLTTLKSKKEPIVENNSVLVLENIKDINIVQNESYKENLAEMDIKNIYDFYLEIKNQGLVINTKSILLNEVKVKVVENKVYLTSLENEVVFISVVSSSINYEKLLKEDEQKYSKLYIYVLGLNLEKDKLMVVLSREFGHSKIK